MPSHQDIDRSPAFFYRRSGLLSRRPGVLHCEGVPLPRLAERFGTPLYVYSAEAIRTRYRAFDAAFRGQPHTVCYSVKANPNLAILRLLAGLGAGFDVVSGGELERVLRASKRAAANTVFSGVGKTADELDLGLRAGLLMFNVESEGELELLAERAARLKKTARVALRVNPDVPAGTHPYISTGEREHKFGIPISQARQLYQSGSQRRWLRMEGVSVHIGSQITSPAPFAAALERVAELVRELAAAGRRLGYVNAGGGLGIGYAAARLPHPRAEFREYARALTRPLRGLRVHLLLEPGRTIVGPAGALLTRVLYLKSNGGKRFIVADAAMNDLIRPSLYGAEHHIVPVSAGDEGLADEGLADVFDVVGPVCESGDFLARDRRLRQPAPGDLLAVLDAGAYGMSISSNYNSRLRPAEALVDGRSARVIRRRDSFPDLVRNEVP